MTTLRIYMMAVLAVMGRSLRYCLMHPAVLMPGIVSPIFMLVAFVGGLSVLAKLPSFVYPSGYVSFLFAAILFIGAGFSGSILGGTLAQDFQTGFMWRLWLALPARSTLLVGHALAALLIALLVFALLTGFGLLLGLRFEGTLWDFALLIALALIFNLVATLWGAALALWFRSAEGNMLANMPFLTAIFLAPLYVPLALLQGWVYAVAKVNPLTAVLDGARSLIAGNDAGVAGAFVVVVGLALLVSALSGAALRKASRYA